MYELFGFELADFKSSSMSFAAVLVYRYTCRAKIPALWNPKQNKPLA
ncbi:hypothetical protein [Klebsiella pneumoniae]|nr:hypothetical protein [Klebsiella pneumoniae]VCX11193.1 hypothetical protein BANRA_05505 [Klebsiella pneumoniae]